MRYPLRIAVLAVAALLLIFAATKQPPKKRSSKEVVWPADQIQFKEVVPGVSRAVLWGDPDKSAYEAITRFKKGQKNALHTHPSDIRIVVLSGTLTYDSGSGENRLGPGSYLVQPGKLKHTSGCTEDADCVFVEQSPGKFGLDFVKK